MKKTNCKYSSTMIKKLNAQLEDKGDDIEHLKSLWDQLAKKKDDLEKELAISNKSSDSEISRLLSRAQSCSEQIDQLSNSVQPLQKDCEEFVASHGDLCARLAPALAAEEARLKEQCYRSLLSQLADMSDAVRERLSVGATDDALVRLRELHQRTAAIVSDSRCHSLAEYCRSLLSAWRRHLLKLLTSALDAALAELRYPFISTNASVHAAPPGPEAQVRLEAALRRLCALAACGEDARPPRPPELAEFGLPSLPVRLLLRPLVKRFHFHFRGDRQTNDPAKPEWYMSQVLQWITDHDTFLEKAVEPTLTESLPGCRPRLEFCRGLVSLAVEKLALDLPDVQYDDATLSHTIDESLQLHRQLAALGYGGSPDQPGPLSALCRPSYLQRWLSMERKYALERLDQMLASETAWAVQGDPEEGVTEVADGALTLLQAMTERYRQLPEPGQRLQFLQLQLELVDDFRVRLLQLLRTEKQQPLSAACCALLNTARHLRGALSEWGERPALLHLQYFRRRLEAAERRQRAAIADDDAPLSLEQVLERGLNLTQEGEAEDREDDLEGLDTTVFDESVQLLQKIEDDIIQLIVDQILLEVRARSRPYRKDAWFAMQSPTEFVTPNISATACPMMQVLAQCMEQLRSRLSTVLFDTVWPSVAGHVADFLYDELVMANNFSPGGAAQLKCDVDTGLVALFGAAAAVEEALRPLRAACALLTLPTGSALLLRETLMVEMTPEACAALSEAGAGGLQPAEALLVLQRRTEMSVT